LWAIICCVVFRVVVEDVCIIDIALLAVRGVASFVLEQQQKKSQKIVFDNAHDK
jgi:hypothetical protein